MFFPTCLFRILFKPVRTSALSHLIRVVKMTDDIDLRGVKVFISVPSGGVYVSFWVDSYNSAGNGGKKRRTSEIWEWQIS